MKKSSATAATRVTIVLFVSKPVVTEALHFGQARAIDLRGHL